MGKKIFQGAHTRPQNTPYSQGKPLLQSRLTAPEASCDHQTTLRERLSLIAYTYMRLLVRQGLTSRVQQSSPGHRLCSMILPVYDFIQKKCLKVRPKLGNGNSNVWHMINNVCFHVYAQKSLFIGENDNAYFWTAPAVSPNLRSIELVPRQK